MVSLDQERHDQNKCHTQHQRGIEQRIMERDNKSKKGNNNWISGKTIIVHVCYLYRNKMNQNTHISNAYNRKNNKTQLEILFLKKLEIHCDLMSYHITIYLSAGN